MSQREIAANARKRFGQNFLQDQNIINNIIAAVRPARADNLIEIGPGHGAITFPLLEQVSHLNVIEIDRDLIQALRLSAPYHAKRLSIFEGDALKMDLAKIATEITGDETSPVRLIGNLPYNISTPLLFHFSQAIERIKDAHFMLQKEVVERMSAAPNSKTYGRLTVMIQALFEVEALFIVPPTAFVPPPKVQSQIVRLRPRQEHLWQSPPSEKFAEVVRCAFSARRKTLRKALQSLVDADGFAACKIDPSLRPENLTVAQYVALSHHTLQ